MKIVVLGDGMLAHEFKNLNFDVITTDFFDMDFNVLSDYDTIINTYDRNLKQSCSDDVSGMYLYNAHIPALLSRLCNNERKRFVHISTSHLYGNCRNSKKKESDPIFAQTSYEASKLLGEQYCSESALIIRTQNLFNETPENGNILYNLIKHPKNIEFPTSFTYTKDVIRSITKLLRERQTGIFNVTSDGPKVQTLVPIDSTHYHSKININTLNSTPRGIAILDTNKLFKYHVTDDLNESLSKCYGELLHNKELL